MMAKIDSARAKRAKVTYHEKLAEANAKANTNSDASASANPHAHSHSHADADADAAGEAEAMRAHARAALEAELMQPPPGLSPNDAVGLLPGVGNSSELCKKLARHNITTLTHLRNLERERDPARLELSAAEVASLVDKAYGVDRSPVLKWPLPIEKLSAMAQMSLTPIPIKVPSLKLSRTF